MPPPKKYTSTIIPPPGSQPLTLPTPQTPSPPTNPPFFNDALSVRLEVFVDEQKCPAEFEIDDDDARSWQWVLYHSNPESGSGSEEKVVPVGVVRLVPPPHASHEGFVAAFAPADANTDADTAARDVTAAGYDLDHEPYIKFGRVAVVSSHRGNGLARQLMETAMGWAEENAGAITAAFEGVFNRERERLGLTPERAPGWKGLALVHAQVEVEGLYKRLGFVTDEDLGRWVEEGIEHVGMWKRLDVRG
ncbi:hypothetical protein ASPVEDRAFT_48876 [Aspergillus versicolor CBS 583.65]|uniref:N-acetyltransferase domain-containing protein n=1 Tax=Aspergillus versicolor CBS 583.65 TaxID=1036611 RepID=A0A1L9P5F5_ASPVE|nr:uncharacterized protein ASPVEDRAFT_48876 [Aspergillus versicolor CBS 583.65]OJI96767.1 hypothetical protein ASPVEDRAFT_48876 [Aspergillus versicolor CBS 583.65]